MTFSKWALALLLTCSAAASAEGTIKVAYIDPLSGLMAATGDHGLRELRFAASRINDAGGILGQKLEIVGMDNKLSPPESLTLLNSAVDQGIRYIVQGNGSSVAGAIIDGVNKNNQRQPDKAVVFLNFAAVDPDFTNSKCSFWHFRFDANSDMKLQAVFNTMAKDASIKKVYIIGQDYSFGQQVSKTSKVLLKEKLPNAQLVGDELHPLARVKDFSPYVAKIQASGADTVVTGNWGSDLALLVRAAKDAGLKATFYTFYAGVTGTPVALGEAGVDRVKVVAYYEPTGAPKKAIDYITAYKKKFGEEADPYTMALPLAMDMLKLAMEKAKSTDPLPVAKALEGMKTEGYFGPVEMRAEDHQMLQPLFVGTFAKVDGKKVKYNADGTKEFGFREDSRADGPSTAMPTICKMERP
jgi:branched-chain amino acid transport system substrate-binding protein